MSEHTTTGAILALPPPQTSALPDADFDEFYRLYPRKVGKGQARRAWTTAIKKADPADIIAALKSYWFSDEKTFIAHPATWLNGERWLDQQSDRRDAYGLREWLASLPREPGLSAHIYEVEELRAILVATGWPATWRGDLGHLNAWMRDGYQPDSVAQVIAAAVAEFGSRATLRSFDGRVRYRAERIGGL